MQTSKKGFVNEINVTPFVDVMLVLLIIFMVTAPMLDQGLDIQLPKTNAVGELPQDKEYMLLIVLEDGSLLLDKTPIDFTILQEQVRHFVIDQGRQLYLKADKRVEYGVIVKVMGELRLAGMEEVNLVAEKEQ